MMVVLAGAVGGAVDFTNATKVRGSLQDVADAGVLAAAALGENKSQAEYKKVVEDIIGATDLCKGDVCTGDLRSFADGSIEVSIRGIA